MERHTSPQSNTFCMVRIADRGALKRNWVVDTTAARVRQLFAIVPGETAQGQIHSEGALQDNYQGTVVRGCNLPPPGMKRERKICERESERVDLRERERDRTVQRTGSSQIEPLFAGIVHSHTNKSRSPPFFILGFALKNCGRSMRHDFRSYKRSDSSVQFPKKPRQIMYPASRMDELSATYNK